MLRRVNAQSPRLGNYELIDRFAVGGVAEIYRARDVRTGGVVVIKRMRPDAEFDPELTAGFLREIQLALLCAHDNLIRGFERGQAGGLDFVVLEYIDGVDLARILERCAARRATLSEQTAAFIVAQVLDGLAFAHALRDERGRAMGLVHRDLTPRNVFVRYDGRACVGDFGSACATLLEPVPTEIIGSPGFLSPEQARMEPLDARSDVFAAGLLLFELLAGQSAFDVKGKKEAQILKVHQKGDIRAIPRRIPEALRLVVEIACAPAREDRYADAATMRAALANAAGGLPASTAGRVAHALRELFDAEFNKTRLA